ncbi:MAG: hypothetical protein R6X10_11100 [Desulfobacterales bacterium]
MRHGMIILGIVFWWTAGTALAHKVNIFAWVEGDTVYTESKFSGGKKVQNAPVEIYGTDGTKLLEGKTNELGEFSFPAIRKTGMKVVLLAGMGHKAEWTVSASELQGNDPEKTEEIAPEKMEKRSASPCLNQEEIRNVVEKVMDQKLQPVIRELRKSLNPDREPDFGDIMGGIGYIVGLIGVAAYVHSRRKKD